MIKNKQKIYLDSDELFGYFKSIFKNLQKKTPFILPENIKKLRVKPNKELITSILTKAEVRRRIRHDNPIIVSNEFERLFEKSWNKITRFLKIELIPSFLVDESFDKKINGKVFKCKIADLLHCYF